MFLSEFYEVIMAHLTSNIIGLTHFDLYWGQYEQGAENEEGEYSFPRPAVFIEFAPMEMQTLGRKRQSTEMGFTLHIVSDVIQEVSKSTPSAIRTKGHLHLQLVDKIQGYMQGFNGELSPTAFKQFGSCDRQSIDAYTPQAMMIIHKLTYRTRIVDDNVTIVTVNPTSLTPPIVVTDEITPEIEP